MNWPWQPLQADLAYHGDYANARYHLARTLDDLGRDDEADRHWHEFLRLAPDSPWAHERTSGCEIADRELGYGVGQGNGPVTPSRTFAALQWRRARTLFSPRPGRPVRPSPEIISGIRVDLLRAMLLIGVDRTSAQPSPLAIALNPDHPRPRLLPCPKLRIGR